MQGSPEWLALRVGMYTGSNAHKLLGSFGASEYAKAVQSSFKGNYWTKRGHILEDEAISLYEQITRVQIQRDENGVKVGFIKNTDYPTCLYSPDGVTSKPLIEVKCFDVPQHIKLLSGDIDIKILAQIHFGLLISGRPYAHLVAYNPELEANRAFKIITIESSKAIHDNFKRILTV